MGETERAAPRLSPREEAGQPSAAKTRPGPAVPPSTSRLQGLGYKELLPAREPARSESIAALSHPLLVPERKGPREKAAVPAARRSPPRSPATLRERIPAVDPTAQRPRAAIRTERRASRRSAGEEPVRKGFGACGCGVDSCFFGHQ